MIAEPVPSSGVSLVAIHPDHDVAVSEDLHDAGHADGGEVQGVHGLQLHPRLELSRRLPVLGEHVRRGVCSEIRLQHTSVVVGLRGADLMSNSSSPA